MVKRLNFLRFNILAIIAVSILGLFQSLFAGEITKFSYKLAIEEDGVYRLRFDDLDFQGEWPDSSTLQLVNGARTVPISINDGGDGRFGPGDHIAFIGQHLSGEYSNYNEFSRYNIYYLSSSTDALAGENRIKTRTARRLESQAASRQPGKKPAKILHRQELQKIRVSVKNEEPVDNSNTMPGIRDTESWYWKQLSHLDSKPFIIEIPKLANSSPYSLKVALTGLSRDSKALAAGMSQHHAEIRYRGKVISSQTWDGQQSIVLEVNDFLPELVDDEFIELELSIPKRLTQAQNATLIDVVLLNWIELTMEFSQLYGSNQLLLEVPAGGAILPLKANEPLSLFSTAGKRLEVNDVQSTTLQVEIEDAGRWYLVPNQQFLTPSWISPVGQNHRAALRQEADYLVISHASLMAGIQPLVDYHENNGLKVSLVDIEDIYHEFGEGHSTPRAIQLYIRYKMESGQKSAPRFVLLVGDAGWNIFDDEDLVSDSGSARLVPGIQNRKPRKSASLAEEQVRQRNLIPTMQVRAHNDFAASDNGLVVLDEEDWRPGLAIGRLPVADLSELHDIVGKILAYNKDSEPGPWRRRFAVVSDSTPEFQKYSELLATSLGHQGLDAHRVYPELKGSEGNAEKQASVIEAFDTGQLVVHFLGHGGRFVWRTGPPDYRHGKDLFSVADLPRLTPNRKLPLVLSMTCSSGPFDHPTAESMAEALLRFPDRGAMAVLAASWRVPASFQFSDQIMTALIEERMSIGEAVLHAKLAESRRYLVESYNLLGDPAMHLSLPSLDIPVTLKVEQGKAVIGSPDDLSAFIGGQVIVDWFDESGQKLNTLQSPMSGPSLQIEWTIPANAKQPDSALVYLWHKKSKLDGMGSTTKLGDMR